MKKILTIILSMVLLLSAASVIAYAEEPTAVDDNTLYATRITATTVTHTVKYIPDNGKELSIKININSSRPVYINIYKDDETVVDHRYTNGNDSYIYTYSSADNKPCEFKIRISDITNDGSPVDAEIIALAGKLSFTDIGGHWAESTINKWADKGIISGYPDGTFKPDSPVTRAELAKILTLTFDLQPSEFVSAMDEVSTDDWYYDYLLCAGKYIPNYALPEINEKNQPYIDNKTEAFLPNQNAMRMHVAEALVEIIKDKNEMIDDVPEMSILKEEINKTFKDADYENLMASHGTIPTNVRRMFKYTYLAKELGIMQGDTDGYFRPYDSVTRAEIITMIDRIISNTN